MKNRQQGGTLLGLAFGLVVGVLMSFGVVWYLNKTPLPFVEKVTNPGAVGSDGKPVPLPGKPGDKPVAKPAERKFEFYDILEGKKAPAPQQAAPKATPKAAAPATVPAAEGGSKLYLQAGAFQKRPDAETLKARLAMFGFEAAILEVDVPGKGVLHRVRTGPYASTDEMNRARDQLSQNGVTASVVRARE